EVHHHVVLHTLLPPITLGVGSNAEKERKQDGKGTRAHVVKEKVCRWNDGLFEDVMFIDTWDRSFQRTLLFPDILPVTEPGVPEAIIAYHLHDVALLEAYLIVYGRDHFLPLKIEQAGASGCSDDDMARSRIAH